MSNQYTTSLFDISAETKDNKTGEVISTTKMNVVKRRKTPPFLMLFTAGTPLLRDAGLNKSTENVLSKILEKWVHYHNRVEISTPLVEYLKEELDYSRTTIYKCISNLKKNKILVEDSDGTKGDYIKGAWYLNPFIFGKGEWKDIEKLRYDLSVEFDFKQLEAKSTATRKATYKGAKELNSENYDVKEKQIEVDETNQHIEAEILVEDKNSEKTLGSEVDVEIIKEKNKSKELDLELKKESNKELELKLKAHELGLLS